jgi:hypothetical protein
MTGETFLYTQRISTMRSVSYPVIVQANSVNFKNCLIWKHFPVLGNDRRERNCWRRARHQVYWQSVLASLTAWQHPRAWQPHS